MTTRRPVFLAALILAAAPLTASAQIVFSGAGNANAGTALSAFTTAIGGPNNGATPTPKPDGFRRITWDGVRLDGTDFGGVTTTVDLNKTVAIPVNRFQNVGSLFAAPYAVSGDGFASVNPATAGQFPAFSPTKTFAMFDDTPGQFDARFIDMSVVLPSNPASVPVQAGTRGFGAIFMDVENANSSFIEFFGRNFSNEKVSLGKYAVPVGPSGQFEFLGVLFSDPVISDVTLTVGDKALFNFNGTTFQSFGAENLAGGIDLAATDDFFHAEPTKLVRSVPEPSTWALLLCGGATLGGSWARRFRKLRRAA